MENQTTNQKKEPLFWNEWTTVYYRGVQNARLVIATETDEISARFLVAILKSTAAHLICRKDLGPDELV